MMSVLYLKTKSGKKAHFCDSRCWNAVSDQCECSCLGANHGLGYFGALENTKKIAQQKEIDDKLDHPNVHIPKCPQCKNDIYLIHTNESKSGLAYKCNSCDEEFEVIINE
jgi:hypothetical protein